MDKSRVVISIDDLCDDWWDMESLFILKEKYPNFKATVFTIPFRVDTNDLSILNDLGWIELAVHGLKHESLDEMLMLPKEEILDAFGKINFSIFARGFKAPGWRLDEKVIECCNEFGMWVALHGKHEQWKGLCRHGYYFTTNKNGHGCWFGHTHDVEDNYVRKALPMLLKRWSVDQEFAFVSEAIKKCLTSL
jgi:hypothetical protein